MANFKSGYADPVLENPCSKVTKSSGRKKLSVLLFLFVSRQSKGRFDFCFPGQHPDFIFNCGGLSVAFIFVTKWDCGNVGTIFSRAKKLKAQFAHLYVTLNLPTRDQNDSFLCSYFKYEMQLGRPTFVPVQDIEMGFEKIVKIAHSCGGKKILSTNQSVQELENFIRVVTSIPGIDNHDANALNQAIGSIEGIAKASKQYILETTDLSADKAETI
ncbi:hypothetical protein Gogos_009164, partial [Gossypium gossypioides]|nr:hypothetical protein [Gossypium gossypioides]